MGLNQIAKKKKVDKSDHVQCFEGLLVQGTGRGRLVTILDM